MDSSEFYQYLELLRKKPSGLFRSENIEEKGKCLDVIATQGRAQHISSLTEFLDCDNAVIREKVAQTIIQLYTLLNSKRDLHESLRHCWIDINQLKHFKVNFGYEQYWSLLTIASFNSSGFVRQQAVRELGLSTNPGSIRFILYRLGDWVKEVRIEATNSLRLFLKSENLEVFLQNLPLINSILKIERTDLTKVHEEIFQFIFSHELNQELYKRIIRLDDRTRYYYYKNYFQKFQIDSAIALLIAKDPYYLVREQLVYGIHTLSLPQQKNFIMQFLADPSSSVRVRALYQTKRFNSEFDQTILEMLSDPSASVRDLSRYLLNGKGINFTVLYQRRIECKQHLEGSILGLSGIANLDSLSYFEKFITSESTKIQLACLKAIYKLDPFLGKKYATDFLDHRFRSVRNAAINILSCYWDHDVLAKARDMYREENIELRKSALKLFNQIGGWSVVADILEGLQSNNDEIHELSWGYLDKWKQRATSLFTEPQPDDLERARSTYERINSSGLKLSYHREKLWKDLPFFFGVKNFN